VTNTTLAISTASMAVPRFNTFDMDCLLSRLLTMTRVAIAC
jgi:hypothetical protein